VLQVDALLARFDGNSDGRINYSEFLAFYPEAKAAYVTILEFCIQYNTINFEINLNYVKLYFAHSGRLIRLSIQI